MADRPEPRRISPGDPSIPDILALIRRSYAGMEGRIDPPSSLHRLTEDGIAAQCRDHEVWTLGAPPLACLFLTQKPPHLYVGKLAVDPPHQGRGLARRLIDLAADRCRALGLRGLELETRIELTENHRAFRALGFEKTSEGRHPGFTRTTFIVMRKPIA